MCNADDRRRQHEACSPSDFQREILELRFEDFITKTNIKDLVLKDHRKSMNNESATLSTAVMHLKLEFYYEYRKRIHEWHKNCMKNLKFKACKSAELDAESAVVPPPQPKPNEKRNSSARKSNKKDSSKKERPLEINDFQREIMALSYQEFVNQTNICDIVADNFRDQFKGSKVMTKSDMEFGLTHYEKIRQQPKYWHRTSLTHLKFKKCECKRRKQFEDKSVATDAIETSEVGCMTDVHTNEITESNPRQLQLAALTVHAIGESQIICIATNVEGDQGEPGEQSETSKIGQPLSSYHKCCFNKTYFRY